MVIRQCINLQVTGTGTANPSGVLGTALYVSTDPGLVFNIYTSYTNTAAYTVPGIPLYTGAIAVDNASGALSSLNPTVVPAGSAVAGTTAAVATAAAPTSTTAAVTTAAAAQACTCGVAQAVTTSSSTSVAPTTTSAAAANACTAANKKKKVKRSHPRKFQA